MTVKQNIIQNYKHLEEKIVSQLALSNCIHGLSTGLSREDIWLQLFEMIIPKKFVIEHSVFIIDSKSNVSHEVDLAIIDNMYTPYIFNMGGINLCQLSQSLQLLNAKALIPG